MPKGDSVTTSPSSESTTETVTAPANLVNDRPANQQPNASPANQGSNDEAPAVLNERVVEQTETNDDEDDEEHSVDFAVQDEEDDQHHRQTDDEDLTMANLDELYHSIPTNPDESDLHPKRDDEEDEDDEEEDTVNETPVANAIAAANHMRVRNHSPVDEPTSSRYLDPDFTPVLPSYYHMTPRCAVDEDEHDFGNGDLLPFGASAATHIEHHLMMNRADSNDTDNEHQATTNNSSRRDSCQPQHDDDLAANQAALSRHRHARQVNNWNEHANGKIKCAMKAAFNARQQACARRYEHHQRHQINVPKVALRSSMVQNAAAVVRARHVVPTSSASVALGWQGTKSTLKERFSFMFCNEILADVHFLVGRGEQRQRVPAHKFVLSVGSAVFDAMFNGALAMHNDNNDIELPDVEPQAFLTLLNFLYSDDVSINPDTVMTTLYTAKKYAVPALETACVDFLKNHLSADNAIMLLTQARLFDESHLAALCLEEIDKHSSESLTADGFTDIDLETLCAVLERDTLRIREVQLFNAVNRWSIAECHRQALSVTPANQRQVLGRALSLIRFPLMTVEEFASSVAQIGILHDREVVNLFLYFTVNPKPTTAFADNPRCSVTGKEQVVNRFQRIEGRWGYSGTPDRIKFTVDRHIYVVGFGLYGSIHGPTEYQTRIEILHCGTSKTVAANETTFSCDGSLQTYRVLFKEPVELAPMVTYVASACLKGPDSHYGTKGLRRIVHQSPSSGCVTFQFTYAAGNNNGTSVEDGQIPEIIFYTKLS